MNYFITGGTGFIGTHLTNLLQELHPECNVYNLDIVEPGTPLPSVEDYIHYILGAILGEGWSGEYL